VQTLKFLSRTQAARRIGRCPKTLRSLEKSGRGPAVLMVGDRPAYPLDELEQWIASNTLGGAE
jgi:hypothetical protein